MFFIQLTIPFEAGERAGNSYHTCKALKILDSEKHLTVALSFLSLSRKKFCQNFISGKNNIPKNIIQTKGETTFNGLMKLVGKLEKLEKLIFQKIIP